MSSPNNLVEALKKIKVNDNVWEVAEDQDGAAILDTVTGDWVAVIAESKNYNALELASVFAQSLSFIRGYDTYKDKTEADLLYLERYLEKIRLVLSLFSNRDGTEQEKLAYFFLNLLFPPEVE